MGRSLSETRRYRGRLPRSQSYSLREGMMYLLMRGELFYLLTVICCQLVYLLVVFRGKKTTEETNNRYPQSLYYYYTKSESGCQEKSSLLDKKYFL